MEINLVEVVRDEIKLRVKDRFWKGFLWNGMNWGRMDIKVDMFLGRRLESLERLYLMVLIFLVVWGVKIICWE